MKSPIVVATPRTGSNVALSIIYNYAQQTGLSKNNLQEFVSLYHGMDHDIEIVDDTIQLRNFREVLDPVERESKKVWIAENRDQVFLERLNLLKQYPKHTFKFITSIQPVEMYDWIRLNYDCYFIERRNKIDQMLSFLLVYEKQRHYVPGEHVGNSVDAPIWWCERFLTQLEKYKTYKQQFQNPKMAYYEDFITADGVDEIKLLGDLGIVVSNNYLPTTIKTIATPYEKDRLEYFRNQSEVVDFINKHKRELQ